MLVVKRVLLFTVLALLTACASAAEVQNMVVDKSDLVSAKPDSAYSKSIIVKDVYGGEETNPLWTSEVENAAFRAALEQSLEQSGLVDKLAPDSKYELTATLVSVEQPLIGLDLTVTSTVQYRVVERATLKAVFDERIPAAYTATFGDSPFAVQRLRLANEGSIKANIEIFIKTLLETETLSS